MSVRRLSSKPLLPSPADMELVAKDFRWLTGCNQQGLGVWRTEDGYIAIVCTHDTHPMIDALKRMAS